MTIVCPTLYETDEVWKKYIESVETYPHRIKSKKYLFKVK